MPRCLRLTSTIRSPQGNRQSTHSDGYLTCLQSCSGIAVQPPFVPRLWEIGIADQPSLVSHYRKMGSLTNLHSCRVRRSNGTVAKLQLISLKRFVSASTSAKIQLIHVQKPFLDLLEKINCTLALIGRRRVDLDSFSCTWALIAFKFFKPANIRTLAGS